MKTKARMHPLRRYLFAAVILWILLPLITRFDHSIWIAAGVYALSVPILSTLNLWIADDGRTYEMTCKLGFAVAYKRTVKRQTLTVKTIYHRPNIDHLTSEGTVIRRVVKGDGSYFFSDLERYFFGSEPLFLAMAELYSFEELSGDESNELWSQYREPADEKPSERHSPEVP